MAWRLTWTESGAKEFLKLERADRDRIRGKLLSTLANPLRHFEKLRGRPEWKLQVGDHRVIALVLIRDETVEVQAVLHRSVAYR